MVPLPYSPYNTASSLIYQQILFVKGSISPWNIQYIPFFYFLPSRVEEVNIAAATLVSNKKLSYLPFLCLESTLLTDCNHFDFNILLGRSKLSNEVRRLPPEDKRVSLLEEISLQLYILIHVDITIKKIIKSLIAIISWLRKRFIIISNIDGEGSPPSIKIKIAFWRQDTAQPSRNVLPSKGF